jgi:uncharacterized protein (TIGR02001 family)
MKKLSRHFSIALLAGALLGNLSVAQAEENSGPWDLSANVTLASDYVLRGISQTDNSPALQGGFDAAHESGFYLGTWASNVKFLSHNETTDLWENSDAHLEIDAYLGYGKELPSGVNLDSAFIYYAYPDAADFDFWEIKLAAAYDMYNLSYYYTNDFFDETTHYLELGLEYGLPQDFTLGATLGYFYYADKPDGVDDDYVNWSLSVSKAYAGFDFKLAYTDTDIKGEDDPKNWADAHAVFSVSKSF